MKILKKVLALTLVLLMLSSYTASATDIEANLDMLQANDLTSLSESEIVKLVAPLFTADQERSGILASVSMAQFILASDYGRSKIACQTNNVFELEADADWTGDTATRIEGKETVCWKAYDSVADSICDHSRYLAAQEEFSNLVGQYSYGTAAQILESGGYGRGYAQELCKVIDQYNLTQYDTSMPDINSEDETVIQIDLGADAEDSELVKPGTQATTDELTQAETVPEIPVLQASDIKGMSRSEIIELLGPLFTEDERNTGVPACVSMAQFILESAYGQSGLTQKSNNAFGMKAGSSWEGDILYMDTQEYTDSGYVTETARWKAYPSLNASIQDHSQYLLNSQSNGHLRYPGITEASSYEDAFQIIKDGGYATSPNYVSQLCAVVDKWGLTRFSYSGQYDTETPTTSEGCLEIE